MAGFLAAHAEANHWGLAAKACQDRIGTPGSGLGFVYATAEFAPHLGSIVTFLRETTRIEDWVGAVGFGVVAAGRQLHQGGGLSVMVADLPAGSYRLYAETGAEFHSRHQAWIQSHEPRLALVHGNPMLPDLTARLDTLAEASGCFLVGGLTIDPGKSCQVAGRSLGAPMSGVMLGAEVTVATALSQGCTPIGPAHLVTESLETVVLSLDGRPALEVLKEEAGEIIARDLRRAAGYIHAALPIAGSDARDYLVRNLMGIDPARGWLAVGAQLEPGNRLMFVRRDPNSARADLRRMLDQIRARVGGARILAGHYTSCVARGAHMFGTADAEIAMIQEALGPAVPLTGFYANGEISHARFYAYTGVLTLFLEGDAS